jgi:arginine decarboxylase
VDGLTALVAQCDREVAEKSGHRRKLGADVSYLDVGGGLGIDYDGSKTSSDASVNYSVQEYANDVVFGVQEVCDEEHVPPPRIVSESGRMMVAYHAMLITDVRAAVSGQESDPPALTGREAQIVQDLADAAKKISVKNYREFYHDAIEYRDQMYSLFNVGMLGLEERGKGEMFFREVATKAVRFSKSAKFVADEFQELETKLHDKYICNFSVFQSVPDHWALDQLFPIIPVHRLNESPTRKATLASTPKGVRCPMRHSVAPGPAWACFAPSCSRVSRWAPRCRCAHCWNAALPSAASAPSRGTASGPMSARRSDCRR